MKHLVRIAFLTLVVFLSPHTVVAQSPDELVPEPIHRLLADRSQAYATKDAGLLEATATAGETARSELQILENTARVSFSVYRFRAFTRFSGDLASPRVERAYPGMEVRAYQVVEETQVAGAEDIPFVSDDIYTFTRSGPDPDDPYEGWRLASKSDFAALGVFPTVHLWDGGPIEAVESEHFVALAHPDRIEAVRTAMPQAEEGYAVATDFWPREAANRYVLIVPSTTDELSDMFRATVDLTKFVAFADPSAFRDEEGLEPAGVRMFVNPPNFGNYDAAGRSRILAHELIHAITRPLAGPFIPSWVEEGLANVGAEGEAGIGSVSAGPAPERFPTDEEFFVGSVSEISRVYRRSQAAIHVFLSERGIDDLARFYESLGTVRTAPGTDEYHLRRATEEAGWSLDAWREAWRRRLS